MLAKMNKNLVRMNEGKFKNGEAEYESMKCHASSQKVPPLIFS